MNQINFFTCCNRIYKDFIPLFILSNLYHNEDAFVEIGVDSVPLSINESLEILNKFYPNKFCLRTVQFDEIKIRDKIFKISPNTVRFINEPSVKTNFVYVSDVDVICLEKNIAKIHIESMAKTKLPYSNIVRPLAKEGDIRKLTGLHFTPHDNFYPIPDYFDLCERNLLNHDEGFLFELVKKRYSDFNYEEGFRPVHGIHISPNRDSNGWGIKKWKEQWLEFTSYGVFKKIEKTFTSYIKDKIQIINTCFQS